MCLAAGLVAASSCQVRDSFDIPSDDSISISLSGNIDQQNITRASDNAFAAGDQVGIWAVNYDGDTPGTLELKGNQATNVRFTFDGNSTWTPDYDIYYKDKNTKVDLYGIYPYTSAISSIDALPFEVREDQSTVSAHGNMGGYEASDFLWAKRTAVTPTPSAVQLTFQHKMSCVVVTLVEGTGFTSGEFASLSKSVLVSNVKRNATINLATGDVTAAGSVSARSTVPAAYEGGFRAIVVPQNIASSTPLFSITIGGTPYTYSEATAFTYLAGKQHNFAVTINKKADGGYEVTVNTSISAWTNDNSSHEFTAKEYVVVNVATPGTLGETLTNAGKNPNAIKYLKVLGTINGNDFGYIRNNMSGIQGINLSAASIEGEKLFPLTGLSYLSSFLFPDGNHGNAITEIWSSCFSGTALTGAVIVPEGVEIIHSSAFFGTNITSIVLPESLRVIEASAFKYCDKLACQLDFPNNLESIGKSAFEGCTSLYGSIDLPDSIDEIGESAFRSCTNINGDFNVPLGINRIPADVANGAGFTSVTMHDGITSIGHGAFQNSKLRGELILPSNLNSIETGAFKETLLSGSLCLPNSLVTLASSAFSNCTRLSGVLIIPEGIAVLNNNVFEGCSNIEGIILPQTLSVIGQNAFKDCFSISTFVSNASSPPTVITGAFDGIPKDNFTVEVPEGSVNDYAYATGWNEFMRISAHRVFSISRRLYRLLNTSENKFFTINAESGASWSIESKPEWVTVSPSSGTGKADITVTVSTLGNGSGNRSGDVVFLLNGKDYRSTLTVEQYDYAHSDGSVLTEQTHSLGSGIPIVFMGDCYDAADIASGSYLSDTREAIGYFFDIEPYKTYRNYFDIYIVLGKSEDSGVGSVNTIRESKFGTQYSLSGGTLENDGTVAFEYAKLIDVNLDLTKALIVMVLNNEDYSGVTYMWNDGSAIAICPKSTDPYPYDFRGLVQHEAGGHGFGKLGDEYIYVNAFIQDCSCNNPHLNQFRAAKANGWYKNLSETSDRGSVPWSHLMYHPTYSNIVDIYEGGFFHTRGIFRSEQNSCMNNNIPYYNTISRQAIVERIMAYAGIPFNLEDFYANDSMTPGTKATFTAVPTWGAAASNQTNANHHHPIIMGEHPTTK
jgi:hypothetical protein